MGVPQYPLQILKGCPKGGVVYIKINSKILFYLHTNKKKFHEIDFDKQKIIGDYIVGFYCAQTILFCILMMDISGNDTSLPSPHPWSGLNFDLSYKKFTSISLIFKQKT